ncbi:MAG: heavy metal-associated domain-containing protein [Patescibacteria group bacterium]
MNSTLKITGLHCASCKKLIESVAADVPGISSCSVDLDAGRADVSHETPEALDALVREIAALEEYQTEIV